jgi:peptide/nickel transport system substrate-binding protein
MVTQFQPNNVIVLQRNPYYWGGAYGVSPTPRIAEVIWRVVPNSLTRLEDVERGSATVAYVDFAQAPQLAGATGVYVPNYGATLTVEYASFNTQKFPFNVTLIRQAAAHAVNNTEMLGLFHGFATSYVGPLAKGMLGYNQTLQPYAYNLTLARQLLAQAGYPGGAGIPPVTMIYATDHPPADLEAALIQASLAQIGITVKLTGLTESQMLNILGSNPPNSTAYPNLTYDGWYWYPDPWAYADWLIGPLNYGSSNEAYYNNPTVNALLSQADATLNQTARGLIYQHIDEIVYNDVPYLWTGEYTNSLPPGIPVASIDLRGFVANPQFVIMDFSQWYLVS